MPKDGNGTAADGGSVPRKGPRGGQQTLAERDQTLEESDQTLSDRDQTLSDRDQQASDEDQAASELGGDHGDPGGHARTTALRAETARERLEVGELRDETATERDAEADRRDEAAMLRDRDADLADEHARALDGMDTAADARALDLAELRKRVAGLRERSAENRERAARDRKRAALDRERAARDRDLARHERELAGTDELTGARRRGLGIEDLQHEIDRARRTGDLLVAAYVDVDGLKAVNDGYGHTAGDELLRDVAQCLRRQMRSYDLIVRLGGDEFLCAVPGVPPGEVCRRFEAISSQLSAGPTARSVSVGVSELQDGDGPTELIERADHDMRARRAERAAHTPRPTVP